ncbi:hypothetical protein Tcan_14483 [Toxocara canis]|uniref:Uncharacterized protein n=1 Tax=Toxocara canis TaxID=6265 RepID=A0A0B2VCB0_TOXCA|nr:hypothetical protein Tcan_14483 [Toxocara canis]
MFGSPQLLFAEATCQAMHLLNIRSPYSCHHRLQFFAKTRLQLSQRKQVRREANYWIKAPTLIVLLVEVPKVANHLRSDHFACVITDQAEHRNTILKINYLDRCLQQKSTDGTTPMRA